jgi:hypothetical protein
MSTAAQLRQRTASRRAIRDVMSSHLRDGGLVASAAVRIEPYPGGFWVKTVGADPIPLGHYKRFSTARRDIDQCAREVTAELAKGLL